MPCSRLTRDTFAKAQYDKAKKIKKENYYEKNLSAQEKTEKQSTRVQKENGFQSRQKRIEEKKKQRQKEALRLILSELFKNKEKFGLSETFQQGKTSIFPLSYVIVFSVG